MDFVRLIPMLISMEVGFSVVPPGLIWFHCPRVCDHESECLGAVSLHCRPPTDKTCADYTTDCETPMVAAADTVKCTGACTVDTCCVEEGEWACRPLLSLFLPEVDGHGSPGSGQRRQFLR